ncbi:MAG: glycosyltransferase family 2 protein [Arenicellales bacterium]
MPDQIRFTCIIPFRAQGPDRWLNLLATVAWYSGLENTELLLVEQDEQPGIDQSALPERVRHLFLYNRGLFNKSWAFNVAAMNTRGEVLAFVDADVLVEVSVIQACFEECLGGIQAINPYSALLDLDEERTGLLRRTGRIEGRGEDTFNRDYKGEYLCFCGGAYVVRSDAYIELGGQDERFAGWGGEDDAMSIKLKLLRNIAVNRNAVAYHLFHAPAQRTPETQRLYQRNLALLEEYRRMTPKDLRLLCDRHRQVMGDPDKYARKSS